MEGFSRQPVLSSFFRRVVIERMWYSLRDLELEVADWFCFVAMLDDFCQSHQACIEIQSLPAISMAIVSIIKKLNSAMSCDLAVLSRISSSLAQHLYLHLAATKEEIAAQELTILNVLNWELERPTVQSWASMFVTRFNLLSDSEYEVQLRKVWEEYLVRVLPYHVSHSHATAELPPFRVACGLFSFGLVWARLLPLEKLCPVDSDEWAAFASSPLLNGMGPIGVSDNLMLSLQAATCCDIPALQEHCRFLGSEVWQWTKREPVPAVDAPIHTAAKFQAASFHESVATQQQLVLSI